MDYQIIISIIIVIILLVCLLTLIFSIAHFLFWIISGVPFVRTNRKVLENLEKEIQWGKVKKFYDLGSGNGDVINFFANRHPDIEFIGYELNFFRNWKARLRFFPNTKFLTKNFFKENFNDADIIFTFLFTETMDNIFDKLRNELSDSAILITNSFLFSNKKIKPFKIVGDGEKFETAYFYKLSDF